MRDLQVVAQFIGRVFRRDKTTAERRCVVFAAVLCPFLLTNWMPPRASAEETQPKIGESEQVFTLVSENTEVRGLAWDEAAADAPRLYVLDHSGKIFTYRLFLPVGQRTIRARIAPNYSSQTNRRWI